VTGQRLAFEPFASLDGVLRGEAIRIMPVGKFYRGERELDIDSDRLKEIAANFKAGLPRFRVPINENHAGVGKIGTVRDIEYLENGDDGPGLYATRYEFTDEGRKLIKAKRFDATSPEIIWSLLDGAKYQDPQTGEYHDNVMVGLALTDRPYFSHDNVALFSADGGAMNDSDMPVMQRMKNKMRTIMDEMMALFKDVPDEKASDDHITDDFAVWTTAFMNDLPDSAFLFIEPGGDKDEDGRTVPRSLRHFPYKDASGKIDLPHLRNALARIPQSSLSAEVKQRVIAKAQGIAVDAGIGVSEETSDKEVVIMSDKQVVTTPTHLPETFTVKAEEFAALKAKADQVDVLSEKFKTLEAQADEAKTKAEKLATDLDNEKRARRRDQLVEQFNALVGFPEKPETLADTVLALEAMNADVAKTVTGWITAADKALVEAGLFGQIGTARSESPVDSFEALVTQIHREKFNADPQKYSDALHLASEQRPDLARAYIGH